MKKITENTKISEIIKMKPEAAEILFEIGVGCVGCIMSEMETIGQGLRGHGFDDEEIKETLEELNKSQQTSN